ncbi:hypothetical protein COM86_12655 [Priestia megaterium]|uniref:hypothetical protein n=1 Tax=Priestia megaterium TaxID=1404 RepID=UPI000BEB36E7|nr:hypothetical protein [Priestia megaterium]MED3972264.1 hypothetical protein [Priestia megaterium]PEB63303.1 hypothetical protein COM86_12655 [Priestia megaterium]
MDYEKQFKLLKEEIKNLEEGKIKNSLTRLENILDCLHNEFVVQSEEKVRVRVSKYINKRKAEINSGKTVLEIPTEVPKLVVHFIPFEAFESEGLNYRMGLDFKKHKNLSLLYVPIGSGYSHKLDKDGVFAYKNQYGYSKLYSTGTFEAVELGMLSYNYIDANLIETNILNSLEEYQKTLQQVNPRGKFMISVQFLNVKGLSLFFQNEYGTNVESSTQYEEEDLILSPVILSNINNNASLALQPIFEELWRTFGFSEPKNHKNRERTF